MGESDKASKRASRRLKVFLPATITHGRDSARIHLLDVSRTGALAHAALPPPLFSRVRLRCEALSVGATVVWVAGNRFGLMFHMAVPEMLLDSMAPPLAGALRERPDHRRGA